MSTVGDRLLPGRTAKVNLAVDLALIWAVLAVVTAVYVEPEYVVSLDWFWLGVILSGIWTVLALILRFYDPAGARGGVEDLAVGSMLVGSLALTLALMELAVPNPAALPPLAPFLVLLWAGVAVGRLIFRPLHRRSGRGGEVLIVGAGPLGRATARRLEAEGARRVRGFVTLAERELSQPTPGPYLGDLSALREVLVHHPVDEVYVAGDLAEDAEAMQRAVLTCETLGIPFALPMHTFRFSRARPVLSGLSEEGFLHFLPVQEKPYQRAVKRLIDIAASAAAILVLSPLLLTVAAIIKLTSKGPVFFRQERVGLFGRHFTMLKFRSMVTNAEELQAKLEAQNEQAGPVFKMKNDPRVTAIGRFIRKYSIDELPQLFNVLKGDMTIVGPRPPVPKEVAQYEPWQRRRLSVRPGLTCIWQVSGRNEISFEEWMLLDMRYIDTWNLKKDIRLIFKTVPVVVTGKGAS